VRAVQVLRAVHGLRRVPVWRGAAARRASLEVPARFGAERFEAPVAAEDVRFPCVLEAVRARSVDGHAAHGVDSRASVDACRRGSVLTRVGMRVVRGGHDALMRLPAQRRQPLAPSIVLR